MSLRSRSSTCATAAANFFSSAAVSSRMRRWSLSRCASRRRHSPSRTAMRSVSFWRMCAVHLASCACFQTSSSHATAYSRPLRRSSMPPMLSATDLAIPGIDSRATPVGACCAAAAVSAAVGTPVYWDASASPTLQVGAAEAPESLSIAAARSMDDRIVWCLLCAAGVTGTGCVGPATEAASGNRSYPPILLAHAGSGPFSASERTIRSSPTLTNPPCSAAVADLGFMALSGSTAAITGAYPSCTGSCSRGARDTVAVPRSWSAAYLSLCQTSAQTRGAPARTAARPITPAPKSTDPTPFWRVTSDARATVAGGLVRTGTATECGARPPSSTESRSVAGRMSLTATEAVGTGIRRVDLKLRTSEVMEKRCRGSSRSSSSPSAAPRAFAMPARSSSFAPARVGSARLARGLSPPISGASETATDSLMSIFVATPAAGASNSPGSGWTSRSAAKTRSSGTAVPFSPLNVAELSCIHLPGFSPSGAYSSAACFMARISSTTYPRR
mmetsp:Transcript_1493/g.6155  ORF Transcript_1493/g.6155 Transcript_1493/m.6155 type:complete len:502 (-) Transcript_1493:347-1852(-)